MQESSAQSVHAGEVSSVSSCRRAQLYSKRSAHAGAQHCHLMQESSALSAHAGELSSVSSCRRPQLYPKRSTQQLLSSASSCRRPQLCQLMQKSSALPKEVISCKSSAMPAHAGDLSSVSSCKRAQHYPKRSAHVGAQLCQLMQESSALSAHAEELSTTQRGQLMQELSSTGSCRIAQL